MSPRRRTEAHMSAIGAPWKIVDLGGRRTRIVDREGRWVCDCRSEQAAQHVIDCVNASHTYWEDAREADRRHRERLKRSLRHVQ